MFLMKNVYNRENIVMDFKKFYKNTPKHPLNVNDVTNMNRKNKMNRETRERWHPFIIDRKWFIGVYAQVRK